MDGSRRLFQATFPTNRNLMPALLASLVLCPIHAAQAQDAYPHADEPIGTVEQIYDGALPPDLAVNTFRNIDRLFPTRTVKAGGSPSDLAKSEQELGKVVADVEGEKYDLYDYLALNQVTGLIVLKDGKVVYEIYQRGNGPQTRWMSMSVAKSISSTLVGAALKDGSIKSLDDNVVTYVPRLKDTAYDGVTVRHVLTMSSGVKWNEEYTDPASDRRALLKAQIAQKPGAAMDVMAALPRAAEPGSVNTYSTGETQVLGEIIRGAVQKPLADYLSEKIWIPYGMEADAKWWLDSPDGVEIGGSGLSATLRDFARFGQFFLDGGNAAGQSVLPDGWTTVAGTPKTLKDGKPLEYGYMWWTGWTGPSIRDKAFSAVGIQGQYVYIDPTKKVVIAQTAAEPKPTGKEAIDPMVFFDAIVAALD
jgi:CubicO group peptidase (beta-lactamase class C family)